MLIGLYLANHHEPSRSLPRRKPETPAYVHLSGANRGLFPALWTLYRGRGDRELLNVSRLTVTLAGGWLLGYLLLGAGAATFDGVSLQMLILASLLTSGYFVINIVLMVRLWQHKALRLPGLSQWGDRLP